MHFSKYEWGYEYFEVNNFISISVSISFFFFFKAGGEGSFAGHFQAMARSMVQVGSRQMLHSGKRCIRARQALRRPGSPPAGESARGPAWGRGRQQSRALR